MSETESSSAVNETVSEGASRWTKITKLVYYFKKVKNSGEVTLVSFHILFLSLLNLKIRRHIREESPFYLPFQLFVSIARFPDCVERDILFYTIMHIVLTNAALQAPSN